MRVTRNILSLFAKIRKQLLNLLFIPAVRGLDLGEALDPRFFFVLFCFDHVSLTNAGVSGCFPAALSP